jgi:hypothetical protein
MKIIEIIRQSASRHDLKNCKMYVIQTFCEITGVWKKNAIQKNKPSTQIQEEICVASLLAPLALVFSDFKLTAHASSDNAAF